MLTWRWGSPLVATLCTATRTAWSNKPITTVFRLGTWISLNIYVVLMVKATISSARLARLGGFFSLGYLAPMKKPTSSTASTSIWHGQLFVN